MNFRLLAKVLGWLLLLLSLTMALCLGYAYWERAVDPSRDTVSAFWVSVAAAAGTGVVLWAVGFRAPPQLLKKESMAAVGLGWLLCGVFGAAPYWLCEPGLSPARGWFESMSGFTTTGATVIADLDPFPRSLLLWRSFTQWLGGLGILVLFVAVLSSIGAGSKSLFRHESSAASGDALQVRTREAALTLWRIYIALSILCFAGLTFMGLDYFDALTHAFTAVSTGGFSPYNGSVGAFDNVWVELWLALFMILGGISFMLYAWLLRGRWDRWHKEEETKYFLGMLALASLAIALDLWLMEEAGSFGSALRAAFFQATSIITTTGYATEDFDAWPALSVVILMLLMAGGGCAGSTSGGIKVSRWLLFFKISRQELINSFRPNQVFSLKLNGNIVSDSLRGQCLFFVALAAFTIAVGAGVFSLLEPGLDLVTGFSAVLATLFNIGPGLGEVGPASNYSGLSSPTLVFLGFLMVIGRLEFFAILALFMPSLWRKY